MTVRTRLLLAQAPLAAGLILLGAVSLTAIGTLAESSQLILRDNFRSVVAAERMLEAADRIDHGEGEASSFEKALRDQEANITERSESDATRDLRVKWEAYRALDPKAARRPAFLQVESAIQRILEINQDAMLLKSEQARAAAERDRSVLVWSTLLALGLAAFASVQLTRRALRPLHALSMAVRRIGEGDLEARARLSGEDEIAEVGRELDQMADKLREYRSSSLGELLQAQQASQAAIDSLPDPVLVFSVGGQVLNVNTAGEMLQGAPQLREPLDKVRAHVLSGRGAYAPRGLEEAIRVNDRALLPRATPLYSEERGISGVTIVLQDVTRLLRFDELKNDLVATVAHEFRTPLTSMRMAVHILLEGTVGALNEKQADLASAARDECERLQGIVEDLLDLSRIQAGKVEVSLKPLPAEAVLEAAVSARSDAARDAGIALTQEGAGPALPVLADPDRIQLVFDNLVNNALRHSPRGGRITLRALPDGERVRFEVADEGPGIPPEYQQRIFEKFFRMPGTTGEGIGLGLYISREVVLAHGGEMGVESTPGQGSRFWFTLRVPAGG